jgi:hypothetical protein
VPYLTERALVVVDDATFPAIRQPTWDSLAASPQARLLLEVRTPRNMHPDFWNGLQVLTWESRADNRYTFDLLREHREQTVLESLSALMKVRLKDEGSTIRMLPQV